MPPFVGGASSFAGLRIEPRQATALSSTGQMRRHIGKEESKECTGATIRGFMSRKDTNPRHLRLQRQPLAFALRRPAGTIRLEPKYKSPLPSWYRALPPVRCSIPSPVDTLHEPLPPQTPLALEGHPHTARFRPADMNRSRRETQTEDLRPLCGCEPAPICRRACRSAGRGSRAAQGSWPRGSRRRPIQARYRIGWQSA